MAFSETPHARSMLKRKRGKRRSAYALTLLSPALLLYAVFFILPICFSLFMSFTEWNLVTREFTFVGLANFIGVASDRSVAHSLSRTLAFMLYMVPASMAIGLGLALLVNSVGKKARQVYRSLLYVPSITSLAVMGIVWKFLMNPAGGYINEALSAIGLRGPAWLQDPKTALASIAIISVWEMSGYNMVVFTSALLNVNKSLYEAVDVDGGGRLAKLLHVTLPQISPTLLFSFMMSVIGSFKSFATVNIMTQGGPNNATNLIGFRIWQEAFAFMNFGRANALSMLVFLILLALLAAIVAIMEKNVAYD